MTREVVIYSWCDGPHGERTPGETQPIELPLVGRRELELCDECPGILTVAQLQDIVRELGRKPDAIPAIDPPRPKERKKYPSTPAKDWPCLYCDYVNRATGGNALRRHYEQKHNAPAEWHGLLHYDKAPDCPLDGYSFSSSHGFQVHLSKKHPETTTIPLALKEAKDLGDPYGVVQHVLKAWERDGLTP